MYKTTVLSKGIQERGFPVETSAARTARGRRLYRRRDRRRANILQLAQGKGIKDALNATARYGPSHLPKSVYVTALKMLLLYHMKPTDAVVLYNRYIGDWGGTSTTYRFEAVSDGGVTAELIKKPMTKVVLLHGRITQDFRRKAPTMWRPSGLRRGTNTAICLASSMSR